MEHNENIGEIFKDAFDGFEADVPSGAWENISQQIGQGGTGSSGSGSVGGNFLTSTGFIAGASTIVGVAITAIVLTSGPSDSTPEIAEVQPAAEIDNTNTIPDNNTILTEGIKIMEETTDAALVVDEGDPVIEQSLTNSTEAGPKTIVVLEDDNMSSSSVVNSGPMGVSNTPYNPNSVEKEDENSIHDEDVIENGTDIPAPIEVPSSNLVVDKVGGFAPLTVKFNNTGSFDKIEWNFGDGSTSVVQAPEHVFEQYGEYKVQVLLTKSGKTLTDYITITVESSSSISSMPNVFSPNGDGYNDVLIIGTERIEQFYMIVIDMNGNTIFESNSPDRNWDGRDMYGNQVPTGKYTYYVQAVGIDGKQHEEYQSVTIMR